MIDGIKILVAPGQTREAVPEDEAVLKLTRDCIEAACEAEDLFELDELERAAEEEHGA